MKIGVVNMPGRFGFGGQCIRTRFFILGVPLFPTSCIYKISNNLGIEVPMTGEDILHAYAKFHFGFFGLIGLFWSTNSMRGAATGMKWFYIVLSLAMLVFSIYSWAKHHSASTSETLRRRIFGKAFMYNMLPEHLPLSVQESLYGELNKIFYGKFKRTDWQTDINRGTVTKSNFPLLYTLAYYQKTLGPSVQSEALFKEIETFLDPEKVLKTDTAQNNSTQTSSSTTKDNPQESSAYTSTNSGANMTMDDAMRIFDELQQKEKAGSQDETVGATQKNRFSQTTSDQATETSTNASDDQPVQMTSGDVVKLHTARERMNKQLLMLAGFIGVGFIIAVMVSANVSSMVTAFIIVLVLFGLMAAAVFLPEYIKSSKDLKSRKKIKVKVRVKDMSNEFGTAYLVLRHNKYGIKKITAPSSYYSTDLLNKELEIYVSKASHVLLDIAKVSY